MSVTFYVAKQGPKYIEPYFGFDHESEMNLANGNADVILSAIGIDTEELIGSLTPQQCRQMADVIEENVNLQRPESVEYGALGAKIINCGLPLDRIRRYAEGLRNLADLAEQYETYMVCYA